MTVTAAVTLSLTALCFGGCADDVRRVVCDTRGGGDPAEVGLCRVWTGEHADDYDGVCRQQGGEVIGRCPSDARVGRCVTDEGFGLLLETVYYSPSYQPDGARLHCENRSSCTRSCTFHP